MNAVTELIAQEWPVILTALSGLIISVIVYLKSRVTLKTKTAELEIEKVELEKIIAQGSYILCPKCGEKIFIAQQKIYTGGHTDESKI